MNKILLSILMALPLTLVAQTTTEHRSELTANVTEPGTLGELILKQTENLQDVVTLHVTGQLNADDLKVLKEQLRRMRNLDMKGVVMTEMPEEQFYDNDTLRSVVLPSTLKKLGNYAFASCSKLNSATLPEGLEEIGNYAFNYCDSLSQINLPMTLKKLGNYVFYDCNLQSVVLPEGLTEMGYSCFAYNEDLTSVTLPSTLKVIPESSFRNCYLSELTIPEGVEGIEGSAFSNAFYNYYKDNKKSITIKTPSTLKYIYSYAFEDRLIEKVELNEGLETLGYGCFNSTHIEEITIPSTVNYCRRPFYNCDVLTKLTFLPIAPPANYNNYLIGEGESEMRGRTLVVPAISVEAYKLKKGYDNFPKYETHDFAASSLAIYNHFKLNVPATEWKPDIALGRDSRSDASDYYGNNWGTLTIEGDGSKTLNIGKLYLYNERWNDEDTKFSRNNYGAHETYYPIFANTVIARNATRADQIELEAQFDYSDWHAICLPFDAKLSDIEATTPNTFYVVREYSGQARAAGNNNETWRQLGPDETMKAKQGYFIWGISIKEDGNYTYEQKFNLKFKSDNTANKNNLFATGDVNVALNEYASEFEHNRGWNLTGNPFACYFNAAETDISVPITLWDSYYERYRAIRPGDDEYVFSPSEAFFIQRSAEQQSITFKPDGRQLTRCIPEVAAVRRAEQSERQVFNLTLTGNDNDVDQARFVINPEAKIAYEASKDATKMYIDDSNISLLYTIENGQQMAINERPEGNGIIALGVRIAKGGTYTLSMKARGNKTIMLTDLQENRTVQLDETGYSFSTESGTFNNRFLIGLNGEATGIKAIDQTSKTNDTYFNLNGQRVEKAQKGIFVKQGRKVVVK